jgi:hypothetical protein
MWDQETKIEEVNQEVKIQQSKQQEILRTQDKIQDAMSETEFEINLDVQNAKLSEVNKAQEVLNANIANMILSLDDTTNSIGLNFKTMQTRTGMEKFVGFFSKQKEVEMRTTRVKEANIESNLNDLIGQSNGILVILQDQEQILTEQLEKGNKNLKFTISARQQAVEDLEGVKTKINDMDPAIMELENRVDAETDPVIRTKLDDELAEMSRQQQELKNEEAKLLAKSQTLETYVEQNKTHINSISSQRTAQQVLIEKLKTDTDQRVILFEQYEHSLKTAQQQETAHKLNEIGTKVDQETAKGMAHIGAATDNRLAEMMESHEGNMQISDDLRKRQLKANDRFARRFKTVMEKHDTRDYNA